MLMQYLIHLAHAESFDFNIASVGQAATHLSQLIHNPDFIIGTDSNLFFIICYFTDVKTSNLGGLAIVLFTLQSSAALIRAALYFSGKSAGNLISRQIFVGNPVCFSNSEF